MTDRPKHSILWICIAGLLLLAWWFSAHYFGERPTYVKVEGGITPVFVLSGSGNLSSFSVYLVSPSDLKIGRAVTGLFDDSFFTEPPVWRIEAQGDLMHGRRVEDVDRVTYGVIPPGYKQKIPPDGSASAANLQGRKYYFHCETTNAPTASGGFQVDNGKANSIVIGLPCLERRDGREMTVPCPKYP
jgi:hypothetical protein